jgi:hypothetical protein
LNTGTAKGAIENIPLNLTACDSTENIFEFNSLLDIYGSSLGKPLKPETMIYKKGGVSGAELVEHNNFDYKYNYEF